MSILIRDARLFDARLESTKNARFFAKFAKAPKSNHVHPPKYTVDAIKDQAKFDADLHRNNLSRVLTETVEVWECTECTVRLGVIFGGGDASPFRLQLELAPPFTPAFDAPPVFEVAQGLPPPLARGGDET